MACKHQSRPVLRNVGLLLDINGARTSITVDLGFCGQCGFLRSAEKRSAVVWKRDSERETVRLARELGIGSVTR